MTEQSWPDQLTAAARAGAAETLTPGRDGAARDFRGETLWGAGGMSLYAHDSDPDSGPVISLHLYGSEVGQPMPPVEEMVKQIVHMPLEAFAYLVTGAEHVIADAGRGWPERWEAEKIRQRLLRAERIGDVPPDTP